MSDDLVLHRGVGTPTKCKSCGERIVFAVMPTSGKSAPFEVDPDGSWVMENGIARHMGKAETQLDLGGSPPATRFTSHFARCKQAASWRKK